mmetsp:Transcript_16471/g.25703  ORF Transcript_16471/g.25703 Transcript_16471/m.25703 type:complete len:355 (-) Transcript_16471:1956-3020(-)|eukprot:CAMPEP_0196807322 /NCGR_PEP_ID=MMETSP1362-20130617/7295_1 /TAXON_ID=163516 /ORGANISM="Leptocylindrus danicus, Strain CCMP1856" /LENGTH=354 /DNA_ID=CAMNT_0042181191 /DNA_START=70 /DNA_END=1134 /DNA_ORIENTATION=-
MLSSLLSRRLSVCNQIIRRCYNNESNAATLLVMDPVSSPDATELPPHTLNTLTAAAHMHHGDITLMIPTAHGDLTAESPLIEVAKKLNPAVKKVCLATIGDGSDPKKSSPNLAENIAECIRTAQHEIGPFNHIVATANKHSANYAARAGAYLAIAPITDVVHIDDVMTYTRPMYAGNAMSKVRCENVVHLVTIRPTAYDKAPQGEGSAELVHLNVPATALIEYVSANEQSSGKVDLSSADVVVSGGRGLKSKENFGLVEKLADKLGGAVGASRAAVDSGFIANNYQVGQTGKVVSPNLYIAVGISGAIQHLSGMKDSKVIVAINKDKEAPIFQVADYGLASDLFEAVPEMTDKL